MAADSVFLTRKRWLGAKLETTTGTAIALADADYNLFASDINIQFAGDWIPRMQMGARGTTTGQVGQKAATAAFKLPLSATYTDWADKILKPMGFTSAGAVYTFDKAANSTVTIKGVTDGEFRTCYGAMGDGTFTIGAGKELILDANYMGIWAAPARTTAPAPTMPTAKAIVCSETTITIGSSSYVVPEFKLALGNNVIRRGNTGGVGGWRSAWITDASPTISFDPEQIAAKDWAAEFEAATEFAFSAVLGSGTGGTLTITAGAIQLNKHPDLTDHDGIAADSLQFAVNDDDLVFTFS